MPCYKQRDWIQFVRQRTTSLLLHKIVCIRPEVIKGLIIHSSIKSARASSSVVGSAHEKADAHLFDTLFAPSTGLATAFGFFFPDALSRCSFCFSFASVVRLLAALRTSTSRKGNASCRTWCSTKLAYRGFS